MVVIAEFSPKSGGAENVELDDEEPPALHEPTDETNDTLDAMGINPPSYAGAASNGKQIIEV
jgi:hypothetical protein